MRSLRDMLDSAEVITSDGQIHAYGTSEGVSKAWDSRGRGRHDHPPVIGDHPEDVQPDEMPETDTRGECVGDCGDKVTLDPKNPAIVVPHLDHLEFMMTSNKGKQNIHFDKEALKTMLRMALVQLDQEDSKIGYLNTNQSSKTDHYATIKFARKGVTGAAR